MMPFLSIGFRPFYLGAAVYAALAVPVWALTVTGFLTPDTTALPGYLWHIHEMVFGFAPAVIVGFLLTAVRNWTGLPTLAGAGLAALFTLWVMARLTMITGPLPLAASLDLAFLAGAAVALGWPLWRARNRRNAFVVPLLLFLGALSAAHIGAGMGRTPGWARLSPTVALDLVAVLMTVIGGRVIPAFSGNALPGLHPRVWPTVERLCIGLTVAVVVADLTAGIAPLPPYATPLLLAGTGFLHLIRAAGWQPWATRGNALLLALPLAYLWLPVHFGLRAWLDPQPGSMAPLAVHALSVGAMAGLMLAMMTRSALGHTGRPLAAGAAEKFIFAAIHGAALVRVAGPLWDPAGHALWLGVSALLWTAAFGAFAVRYAPILMSPRLDIQARGAPAG